MNSQIINVTVPKVSIVKLSNPDELLNLVKQAQAAANRAENVAEQLQDIMEDLDSGNMVTEVTEENGVVTVKKINNKQTQFTVVKSVEGNKPNSTGDVKLLNGITFRILGDSNI